MVDLISRWPSHACTVCGCPAAAKVARRKGMPKFMQKVVHAVGALGALVSVLRLAPLAVQPSALGNAFDDHIHFAVGPAAAVVKDKLIGSCVARLLELSEPVHEDRRQRNDSLLPVLRREAPLRLRRHPDQLIAKVDVPPLCVANLLVAESRAKNELQQRCFALRTGAEHRLPQRRVSSAHNKQLERL